MLPQCLIWLRFTPFSFESSRIEQEVSEEKRFDHRLADKRICKALQQAKSLKISQLWNADGKSWRNRLKCKSNSVKLLDKAPKSNNRKPENLVCSVQPGTFAFIMMLRVI